MGEIQISAFDMATSTYALARSTTANGNVEGSGVRLRKLPKSNATVLELMYNKETVRINYTKSSTVASGNWYYVKRIKTGTWGWVNYKYLLHWD
nr:SH3 domain-containing protein [Eubacterium sp.]